MVQEVVKTFDWVYRRIAEGVIGEIEAWLQNPDNIKQLTALADALVDREVKRLIGSFAGAQKGMVQAPQEGLDLGGLLTSRGGISSKKVLGLILNKFLVGGTEPKSGSLP